MRRSPARRPGRPGRPGGDSAGAHLRRRRRRVARARRRSRSRRPRRCRCSPAIASARRTAASRSCSPTAARCTSTPTPLVDFQSDEVVRLLERPRAPEHRPAARRRSVAYRVDAPSAGCRFATPGEYRVSVIGGERRGEKSSSRSCAARRSSSTRTDARRSAPASARSPAPARRRRPSYVFNSAAWDAFDRWSEARRDSRLGVSAAVPARDRADRTRRRSTSTASWQNEPTYGYVWYPRVASGWRPYYYGRWTTLRPWGWTWIGIRSVGVADASLRPLGLLGRRVVLDSRPHVGTGVGLVGLRAGLRQLVPARLEQPRGLRVQRRHLRRPPLRPVERVDGRARISGFGRGYVNVNVVNRARIDVRTRDAFVDSRRRAGLSRLRGPALVSAPIRSAGARDGASSGTNAFLQRVTQRAGPASSSANAVAGDPGAAFRSRRSSSAPLSGQRLSGAGRQPRDDRRRCQRRRDRPFRARVTWTLRAAAVSTIGVDTRQDIRTAGTRGHARRSASVAPFRRASAPDRPGAAVADAGAPESRMPNARRVALDPAQQPRPRPTAPCRAADAAARDERLVATSAVVRHVASSAATAAESPDASDRTYRATPRPTPTAAARTPAYRAPDGYRSRPGPERSAPAPSGARAPQSATPSRAVGVQAAANRVRRRWRLRARAAAVATAAAAAAQPSGRAVPRGGRG